MSCTKPDRSRKPCRPLAARVKKFLLSQTGPTAVEYAVMLALLIAVCLVAITAVGTNTNTLFVNAANSTAGS